MKRRILKIFLTLAVVFIFAAAIYIAGFTRIGYFMTISFRGFTKISSGVYIDQTLEPEQEQILASIEEAILRNSAFWDELESKPVLIISADEEKLRKMGSNSQTPVLTATYIFYGAHSYIIVSPELLDVDILAHELTHAELHKRLYKGILLAETLVPFWFDEGVAMQNDDRQHYNYEAWVRMTRNGTTITDFHDLETAAQFYDFDSVFSKSQFHYVISKHEVREWIERNGMEKLKELIKRVNKGEDFYHLYETNVEDSTK